MPAKPMDEAELTERVTKALGGREVEPVTTLTGGASSLTYWTTIKGSGEKVAVKACPPGLDPVRNRDMLRQARAQKAVAGSVPVPNVLAEDAGDPPDVPPFFVMEFAPGVCSEITFAGGDDVPPANEVRGRQLDCARMMGEMHRLDPAAVGLGDEPETSLAAEVQRWTDSLAVCDEDLKAGTEDVGQLLLATQPTPLPSALLHGDFRTGNVMAEGDHVTAVIDWEIWSIGDPRIDLAWFLVFVEDARRTPPPGTPSVEELLATYQQAWGQEVVDLDWFRALVRYKQVSAGAFIQRNARRRNPDAPVVPVDNSDNWLLTSARELLG